MEEFKSELILGHQISSATLEQTLSKISNWLSSSTGNKLFFCANPHSLVLAKNDLLFSTALNSADLLTPDGAGIIIASRILGGQIRKRITGSDIFFGVCELLNLSRGRSCFFLGSSGETLNKIEKKMGIDFPNIRYAGSFSPPFKDTFSQEDNKLMLDAINSSNADVLWVAMTAPKQEKWIYQNRKQLNVRFVGAVGAVFDFYAGNIRRSHPIFQENGLEWLPRLIQEPKRLFRRNFISSPVFLLNIFKQRFM